MLLCIKLVQYIFKVCIAHNSTPLMTLTPEAMAAHSQATNCNRFRHFFNLSAHQEKSMSVGGGDGGYVDNSKPEEAQISISKGSSPLLIVADPPVKVVEFATTKEAPNFVPDEVDSSGLVAPFSSPNHSMLTEVTELEDDEDITLVVMEESKNPEDQTVVLMQEPPPPLKPKRKSAKVIDTIKKQNVAVEQSGNSKESN